MEKGSRDLLKHRMWISYCAKNRSTCKRINKKQGTCPRPGPHTSLHCLAHGDSFKGTNENHCLGFFSSLISRTRRSSRAEFAEITVPTPGAAHGHLAVPRVVLLKNNAHTLENRTGTWTNAGGHSWDLQIQPYLKPYLKPAILLDFPMTGAHMCFLHLSLLQFSFCSHQQKPRGRSLWMLFFPLLKKNSLIALYYHFMNK